MKLEFKKQIKNQQQTCSLMSWNFCFHIKSSFSGVRKFEGMFANEFLLLDEIMGLFKLLVHMFVEDIGVDGTLLMLFIAAVKLLEVPPSMSFLSSIAAAMFN